MYEHDACGLGFVARVDGRRTRETVEEGLEVLCNLEHRGTSGSDPETGDGAGILTQIPDAFFRREAGESWHRASARGPLRGRHALRVRGRGGPRLRGFAAADRRRGGAAVPRLQGRSRGAGDGGEAGQQGHAAHPAVLRRAAQRRRGGLRAQALRHPAQAAQGGRGDARRLRREPLVAHGGVQGPAQGGAAGAVLPGPRGSGVRERHRAGPRALLDQHVGELGARAPVPLRRPQRRDQHPQGQHKLDARPREPARVAALRRRPGEDLARSSSRTRATRPPSTTRSSSCTSRGAASRTRWP